MNCIAAVASAARALFVIEPIDVPEPAEDEVADLHKFHIQYCGH
jgi:Zn-dependent alcohol dehydrogenase